MKRLKYLVIGLWLVAGLSIGGCALMDSMAGVKRDAQGNVIGTSPNSPLETAAGFLSIFGPWGAAAGAAIRWGTVEYKHYALVKAGKKDDDNDGQEDPPTPPAPGVSGT